MHVRNANHSINSYGNENVKQEIFFLEIRGNGSLTFKEILHEASQNLIDLFIPRKIYIFEDNQCCQSRQVSYIAQSYLGSPIK